MHCGSFVCLRCCPSVLFWCAVHFLIVEVGHHQFCFPFCLLLHLFHLCRRTPLHWAAVCNRPNIVRLLLVCGGQSSANLAVMVIRGCHHSAHPAVCIHFLFLFCLGKFTSLAKKKIRIHPAQCTVCISYQYLAFFNGGHCCFAIRRGGENQWLSVSTDIGIGNTHNYAHHRDAWDHQPVSPSIREKLTPF